MTPYELNIILMAHCSTEQPYDGKEAPIYHETMGNLIGIGLFIPLGHENPGVYAPTEKLHAFAKFLCTVPLPVMNWSIPGTNWSLATA